MILHFADETPEWIISGKKTVDCRTTGNPLPKVGTVVKAHRADPPYEHFANLTIIKVWASDGLPSMQIIKKEGYESLEEFTDAIWKYNKHKLQTPGMQRYFFEFTTEVIPNPATRIVSENRDEDVTVNSERDIEYKDKSEKSRREFSVENNSGEVQATGVLYREGNVQVLWRVDIGYTGEQYCDISRTLGILPGANVIRMKE